MIKEKQIENEDNLEKIDGGRINPTWEPVDEKCPACNKEKECPFPVNKGCYDNCPDCRLFN